jgi:hypothetical protein
VKKFSSDPMSWHEVVGCDVCDGLQKHVRFVSEGRVVKRKKNLRTLDEGWVCGWEDGPEFGRREESAKGRRGVVTSDEWNEM